MNTEVLLLVVCIIFPCLRKSISTDVQHNQFESNMTSPLNSSGDSEMKFTGIFKSLDGIKKCLSSEKYSHLPEVQELLQIFNENYSPALNEDVERSQRKVFIVLEGIDASGKTTISQRLSKLILGRQLVTPPPSLVELREKFDAHEMELRRAYYSLGNYLAAQEVRRVYKTEPVIMDRFWHSTAAYAIAHEAVEKYNGTLPPEGDEIYEWPADLVKPDIVFFLSVSESKRLDRLLRRKNKTITREELRMKDNKLLREALAAVYSCMRDPAQVPVDSDVTVEEVLVQLVNILKEKNQIDVKSDLPSNEES